MIRELWRGNADSGRQIVLGIYKQEVYIKRCIAAAGDTLETRDQVVYINGRPQAFPPEAGTYFRFVTNGRPIAQADI